MAGKLILVVDDNEVNRRLLRAILERRGYRVGTAGSAAETRAALQAERPDLILMDVRLPDIDGLSLTRELKSDPLLRDIPVIAVTAHAMKGDEEKFRAAGCNDYVSKPIDKDLLMQALARCLHRR